MLLATTVSLGFESCGTEAKVTLRPTIGRSFSVRPDLGPQDQVSVTQTVAVMSIWGALSDERMGLSFTAVQISTT
jgi:hypothetical protein